MLVGLRARDRGYVPLLWRLFLPNAAVLAGASAILILAPPNGRVLIVLAGLVAMLLITLALTRYAFAPLERLMALMQRIDPLEPGQRLRVEDSQSEVTELAEAFNAMLDRLETERRESARRERTAEEEHRRRVARELHDEVGQCLTALKLQLERALAQADEPVAAVLRDARETTSGTLETVRRLARELRPEALDDLGLVSALTSLSTRLTQQTGVRVRPRLTRALPPLTREQELVLYRVAQESLTNAIRHAGGSTVELRLERDGDGVTLTVADDGRGLTANGDRGGGIRGMRERALLVGGNLSVESPPAGGVEVRLQVPIDGAAA